MYSAQSLPFWLLGLAQNVAHNGKPTNRKNQTGTGQNNWNQTGCISTGSGLQISQTEYPVQSKKNSKNRTKPN